MIYQIFLINIRFFYYINEFSVNYFYNIQSSKMVYIFQPGQFFLNFKKKFFILLLYQVKFF
jgi:hypothetical protein